jgi:membrane-associated phospholipid phosphatase
LVRALLVVALAASVGFGLLAARVASGAADAFDGVIVESFHLFAAPPWQSLLALFTDLGRGEVLTVVGTIVFAAFLIRRQWLLAFAWWFTEGGAGTLTYVLKTTFGRARPLYADPRLVEVGNLSFPSGHTMMTTVFVGFALYLFLQRPRSRIARTAAVAGTVAWCALMGFSRLYLGNHYVSDVLGGYLAGIGWLAVCIAGLQTVKARYCGNPGLLTN